MGPAWPLRRDPAKGQGIRNGRKGADPMFWRLPSHEEQESSLGEVPLEVVLKVGSAHTGSHGEMRTVFQAEGPA